MALQLNYNDDSRELVVPNAYAKIGEFNGNKEMVIFTIEIFTSISARENNKQALTSSTHRVPYSDGMSIQGLYNYLKTLPEFANAVDV